MTVYVDELRGDVVKGSGWRFAKYCHLTADTLAELHAMAQAIGLKREWFQDHPTHPHYDLNSSKRALAIQHGAVYVPAMEQAKRRMSND